MLADLGENRNIDYVIVHKVDRLARNRADDVSINAVIGRAGAMLISCSENIDETPSGRLLYGIMSTLAEYYSVNLGAEVSKGMEQKARSGGTPRKAPLGYINVRETTDDGREVRVVGVDPERGPLIAWAFEQYATGDWSIHSLRKALEERGLTTRPSKNRPSVPIANSKLHYILRNRYYLGIVKWKDAEYPGNHEPLVDERTFEQVQRTLDTNNINGNKSWRHDHYLKNSVYCGRCGSRLGYTLAKKKYSYFYCGGRQRRNGCPQGYVNADVIERAVEGYYQRIALSPDRVERTLQLLHEGLTDAREAADKEAATQERRIIKLQRERQKLLQLYYDDAIELDLFKTEQARIATATNDARVVLEAAARTVDDIKGRAERVLDQLQNCHTLYRDGEESFRRELNMTFFEKIYIEDETVTGSELQEPAATLMADDLIEKLEHELAEQTTGQTQTEEPDWTYDDWKAVATGNSEPSWTPSSKVPVLVGPPGFEPGTSSLSGMRSNQPEL